MEDFERFLNLAYGIRLVVTEAFYPDGGIATDFHGPDLVVAVGGLTIAALTEHGRVVAPLTEAAKVALVAAAETTRGEHHRTGVDTALGRRLTTLSLQVDHPRGPSHSFASVAVVNHCATHMLSATWSHALRLLRDAVGPLPRLPAAAWDLAMTWTAPIDLGPVFAAGGVVAAPHLVTTIAVEDGPVYLRTGQPAHDRDPYRSGPPSVLYRFDPGPPRLVDEDRGVAVAGDGAWRWTLPCGGGALAMHHGHDEPRRLVIRVDDPIRGVYVQRA
ncbi:MAG TPA: hypothetical protein VM734_20475 [Kofleriaceae bacterium]|nr:hypothetical protein [Kofleriaceae bacterium]